MRFPFQCIRVSVPQKGRNRCPGRARRKREQGKPRKRTRTGAAAKGVSSRRQVVVRGWGASGHRMAAGAAGAAKSVLGVATRDAPVAGPCPLQSVHSHVSQNAMGLACYPADRAGCAALLAHGAGRGALGWSALGIPCSVVFSASRQMRRAGAGLEFVRFCTGLVPCGHRPACAGSGGGAGGPLGSVWSGPFKNQRGAWPSGCAGGRDYRGGAARAGLLASSTSSAPAPPSSGLACTKASTCFF